MNYKQCKTNVVDVYEHGSLPAINMIHGSDINMAGGVFATRESSLIIHSKPFT